MQSKGANLAGYTHIDVCMNTPWLKIKTRVYKGGKAGCKISEWVSDGSKTISSLSRYTLSNLLQMSVSQPIKSKEGLFQLSILPKICQEAVQKNYERQKIFSYMVRSNSVTYSHINFFLCHQNFRWETLTIPTYLVVWMYIYDHSAKKVSLLSVQELMSVCQNLK